MFLRRRRLLCRWVLLNLLLPGGFNMLVLTRKLGQAVRIRVGDETVRIAVLKLKDGSIKLGFNAANHVKILRDELDEHGRSTTATNEHATAMGGTEE